MSKLSQQQVLEIIDRVMKDITNGMDEFQLSSQDSLLLSENVCSIRTKFEGGYHATLTLSVDTPLLMRLAKQVMELDDLTPDIVEDFAKEYFNVICGHIAAKLFQTANISSRFQIPVFSTGPYIPEEDFLSQEILSYINDRNEGAQLIHWEPSDKTCEQNKKGVTL